MPTADNKLVKMFEAQFEIATKQVETTSQLDLSPLTVSPIKKAKEPEGHSSGSDGTPRIRQNRRFKPICVCFAPDLTEFTGKIYSFFKKNIENILILRGRETL